MKNLNELGRTIAEHKAVIGSAIGFTALGLGAVGYAADKHLSSSDSQPRIVSTLRHHVSRPLILPGATKQPDEFRTVLAGEGTPAPRPTTYDGMATAIASEPTETSSIAKPKANAEASYLPDDLISYATPAGWSKSIQQIPDNVNSGYVTADTLTSNILTSDIPTTIRLWKRPLNEVHTTKRDIGTLCQAVYTSIINEQQGASTGRSYDAPGTDFWKMPNGTMICGEYGVVPEPVNKNGYVNQVDAWQETAVFVDGKYAIYEQVNANAGELWTAKKPFAQVVSSTRLK